MDYNFTLTHEQVKQVLAWDHDCPLEGIPTAIGGRTTFSFTPTSIGVAETVSCTCGAKLNLTNYDEW